MKFVASDHSYQLDPLQRIAMNMMAALILLTFVATNMQALLWQSSDWLVSTVLPAVVVDLTNDERTDLAVVPLQRNTTLDQAAQLKAEHMAQNEYFAHFAPDGTTPWSFFSDAGYVYAHAGENLAIHFTDSTEVVEAWMLSPAHRKNIVDSKFTEIGVGTAKGTFDGYDTVYVVQLFGAPAIAPAEEPVAPATTPAPVAQPDMAAELAAIQAELDALTDVIVDTTEVSESAIDLVEATEVLGSDSSVAELPAVAQPPVIESDVAVTPALTQAQPQAVPPSTVTLSQAETVIISTELSTSSGLAVASMVESPTTHAGATLAAVATQPNVLLDIIYTGILGVIIVLLVVSLVGEVRRLHVVQVAYSIALLFAIGGLWYVHALLTGGAVIA